ncbi:MAG: winged helix-turn-helix domain-containing protein [Methanothrix sp.]|nr:winged helix-turn-helix domain-containing protein [Methanothrix sp.]
MLILKIINLGREIIKRSKHNIISEILEICKDGASKTRIVYQANLNFRTVNPYIDLMIKNGLIDVSYGNNVLYETTEKGMNLLENFKQINNELKELR